MDRERFRVGRKLGRTIYREVGDEPGYDDELIGIMDTPEWGRRVVEALNVVSPFPLAPGETLGELTNPDREMWVYRFQRDGEPREIHERRNEQPDPYGRARALANEVGGPVAYTAAYITANYHWRYRSWNECKPSWDIAWPKGAARARRVEACPNGCGDRAES